MDNAIRRNLTTAALLGIAWLAVAPMASAEVSAREGWARASAPGAKTGAIYLTLVNEDDAQRKLMKIVSPVSDEVMVHLTSVTEQGVARMWPMAVLAVEAGQTLRLVPGGLHVMLGALKAPLVAGQKIPLTMKFDGGQPEFTMMIEVRPLVPAADEHQH